MDGAYGALAALSDRFRGTMAAIGDADSVSLDPHKFLFCAFEAGCVLVRDRARLHHAFSAHPSYLTMSQDDERVDFANYGPQLSRAFKALKGPIQMVTAPHAPVPFSPDLEDLYIPGVDKIEAAVRRTMAN